MRGVSKIYKLSPSLQTLLGETELSRLAAVKHFWAYVKSNNLQDPSNGRIIIPNEKIKRVFQVSDNIQFTQVSGLISKHLEEQVSK